SDSDDLRAEQDLRRYRLAYRVRDRARGTHGRDPEGPRLLHGGRASPVAARGGDGAALWRPVLRHRTTGLPTPARSAAARARARGLSLFLAPRRLLRDGRVPGPARLGRRTVQSLADRTRRGCGRASLELL